MARTGSRGDSRRSGRGGRRERAVAAAPAFVKRQIPWGEKTTTVTTVTFKRIKEFVLELKEQVDRQNVLVSPDELRGFLTGDQSPASKPKDDKSSSKAGFSPLELSDRPLMAGQTFTDAEMMTAVKHLENHG